MKKPLLLTCVLVLALLLTGCALVEKDETVDMATPVITIGDIVYTKGMVLNLSQNMFQSYGSYYGATDASDFIDMAVDNLRHTAIERYMIGELGFSELSEADRASVNQNAEAEKNMQTDLVKNYYFADSQLEGEELDEAVVAMMGLMGYTDETFTQSAELAFQTDMLHNLVNETVTVTEEEARANFDGLVASAKDSYAANLSAFGSSYNSSAQIYYTPAGYRTVKSLQIKFKDDDNTAIAAVKTELSQKQALLTSLENSKAEFKEIENPTEEQQTALDEIQKDIDKANEDITALDKKLLTATDKAYKAIADTVAEVRAKLAEGEDFDTLMTTYGKDNVAINLSTGYAICEGFTGKDEAMVTAAMALKAPGDITAEDVKDSNGIRILKYIGDLTEGQIDFETVKTLEAVTNLTTKQAEAYETQLHQWEDEIPIKVDVRSLKD